MSSRFRTNTIVRDVRRNDMIGTQIQRGTFLLPLHVNMVKDMVRCLASELAILTKDQAASSEAAAAAAAAVLPVTRLFA